MDVQAGAQRATAGLHYLARVSCACPAEPRTNVCDGKRPLLSGYDVTAGSSASGGLEAPRCRTGRGVSVRPLPRSLGVLDAVGRGAHLRLAAKHRPFAAPQHNPAAVVRAKIEQRERVTGSRGLGGLPTSQPPQLVLNGVSRGAEFGGDPAEPETLRLQDQQPLDRDRGPRKPGLQRASNTTLHTSGRGFI
jgi:hypothetical protein